MSTLRYRWDKKYLYWGVTAFVVIAAGILLIAVIFKISALMAVFNVLMKAFTPVMYGLVIAFLVDPIVRFCERMFLRINKKRLKADPVKQKNQRKRYRVFSILISLAFVFAMLAGLIILVIPQLITSMTNLVTNFESYYKGFSDWVKDITKGNESISNWVNNVMGDGLTGLVDFVRTNLLPQTKELMSTLTSGIMGFIGVLKDLIIGFIIAIYFLHHKEKYIAHIKMVIYSFLRKRWANGLINLGCDVNKYFGGFITGKIIDSAIIGVICFVVMSIFRFDYTLLISVIVGVTNIIPFFGPFIGAIPSALILLIVDPWQAVWFVVWVLILQQLDGNVIGPLVLGNRTGVSGFWVITSIAIFGSLFGLIGIIVAVPLCAVILVLIKRRIKFGLKRRKMALSEETYLHKGIIYQDDNPPSDDDPFYKEPVEVNDLHHPPHKDPKPTSKLVVLAKKLKEKRDNYKKGPRKP